jgi:hypothetical protein
MPPLKTKMSGEQQEQQQQQPDKEHSQQQTQQLLRSTVRPTHKSTSNKLRKRIRSRSAPAGTGRNRSNNGGGGGGRKRLVEQHFKIDKENHVLLPGLPQYDDDLARDIHDFFNLIFLVPIVVLNVLNWDWDKLLYIGGSGGIGGGSGANSNSGGIGGRGSGDGTLLSRNNDNIPFLHAWNGEYFDLFFWTTVTYFTIDLIWVCLIPNCVKSPSTIIQHHLAVFVYLTIPYFYHQCRFLFGVCMSVELNTWFLIARRVFNKQGFPPWTIDLPYFMSVRVKLISICFYISWITIRCILYPYVVWVLFAHKFLVGDNGPFDEMPSWAMIFALFCQSALCCLNVQWTMQLFTSKIRQWRTKGETKIASGL